MSFTKASFQVLSFLEQFITIPYLADINNNRLVQNVKYNNNSIGKVVFDLAVLITVLVQPVFSIHLAFHLFTAKHNPMDLKLDQLTYFSINVAVIAIANASNFVIITHHYDLQLLISELCRVGNGISATSNFKLGKLKLKELFIHSICASTLTVALACGITPFVIDWEPVQYAFGTRFIVKLFAACIYAFTGIYSGKLFVSTYLLVFILLENTARYTNTWEHMTT